MAPKASDVLALRAERDASKLRLDDHVARLKADYEERGLGGMIIDEVTAQATSTMDEAADIVGQSKGVIAGTVGILTLWVCRKPIISALSSAFGNEPEDEGYY